MAFLSLAASTSAQGLDAHFASLQTFLMDDADVLLEFVGCDDARTLPAHSQILKIGCSVLREVLKTCKRNSQGLLILPLVDDSIDAWKLLLVFMYGGLHSPPEITWATGRAVVPLAHKYDCQAVLHSHLMRLMQLPLSLYPQHASYAPDWYHLAECLKLEALRQRCRDYLFRCVSDEKVDILHLIQVSERLGLPELYVECLRSQRWLTGSLLCDRSGLLRLHPATLCDLLSFLGSREGAVAGSRGDGQSALRKKMQEAFVNDLEQQMSRIQASFSERRRPLPTP